ncbi:MAG: peptidyl-prolyl cis-trans isomerase [Betaproteobacteria bacterium AqS2]|uniref:Periplasmic chaperone PpiD n=1 Tax=Candidatus Amphirhobacter heronislandensis TaxID=1732024 RepID=A0A930Y2T1_9GAMM|nr:peptidyl-prolyl cis-trans isomerase [Betaproteobacteria bacterium AqS2]
MFKSRTSRLIGVIAVSLPMVLVGAFSNFGDETGIAVRVENRTLTNGQLLGLVESQIEELVGVYPRSTLESPEFIESLVAQVRNEFAQRLLLVTKADDYGLRINDEELAEAIASNELFRIDGRFSMDRYQAIITNSFSYESTTRDDLLLARMRDMFEAATVVDGALDLLESFDAEVRKVRHIALPIEVDDSIEITDAQVAGYYNENLETYVERAATRFAHLTLVPEDFTVEDGLIDEEELRQDYEARQDRLQGAAERQLGMIMFEAEDEAAAAYEELQAGADFAEMARERSIDTGSSAAGGDIGLLSREDLPAAVAEVVFSTPVGELVPPQDLEGSWAVFEVKGAVGGSSRPFEEVRDELVAQRRADELAQQLEEMVIALEEKQAEDEDVALADLAANFGFEAGTSDWLPQTPRPGDEAEAPFDDPEVLAAARDEEFAAGGQVSPAISLAEGGYAFLQPLEVRPERVIPLSEVEDKIRLIVRRRQVIAGMLEEIQENLNAAAAEDGPALPYDFDAQPVLEVSRTGKLPEPLQEYNRLRLFDYRYYSNRDSLPMYVFTVNPAEDTIDMLRVDAIEAGELDEESFEEMRVGYRRTMQSLLEQGMTQDLQEEYDVNTFAPEQAQAPSS